MIDTSTPLGTALALVLALCGGAGLVGVITAIRGWRTDRWANEGALIKRLNDDSIQQGIRADNAEGRARAWEDQAGRYRRQLVDAGITPDDTVWLSGGRDVTNG